MVCSVAVINVSAEETNGDGKLKISVVNFDSKWGDVNANVAKMVDYIEKAKEDNVEFLVSLKCVSVVIVIHMTLMMHKVKWQLKLPKL